MVKEFTPDLNRLKAVHKDYLSWKKASNETLLRNNNSIGKVQVQAKSMAEAGGKEAVIARLLYAQHNTKHVEYYFDMNSKDKKALNEDSGMSGFEQFKNAVMESFLNEETGAEQGARLLSDMDALYPKWTNTSTSQGDKDIYKKELLKYLTKTCGNEHKKDIQTVIDQIITKNSVIENGPKNGRQTANLDILRTLVKRKILPPPNA
jgi:hypothetical protein